MKVLKLVSRNMLRHKLRTLLTILGVGVAVMAFGLLRTVVSAWYAGVDASASNRLITRHSVSFIFPLPLTYRDQIAGVPGVTGVSYMNWFQGVFRDNSPENFFPRMAVDPETIFDLYPEFIVDKDQYEVFKKERNSCIIGEKIAKQFNFKIGDVIPIKGDIYPGDWEFVVRGIYKAKDKTVDATELFFHWSYLDERVRQMQPTRAGQIGWYAIRIANSNDAARVSEAVDKLFANSPAETKTETEKAFQQGFVSLSGAIITSLKIISYVIIGIILLVLMNTMVMTARERIREYAVLRTLGFTVYHVVGLIFGESLLIAGIGGIVGILTTYPIVNAIGNILSTFFPVFNVETSTVVTAAGCSLFVGGLAALFPAIRSVRIKIVDGLRQIG